MNTMKNIHIINQHIYITSNLEDIKENDYIITKDGALVQVSYLLSKDLEEASKVVLTTNQDLINDGVQAIDNDFLNWFVKNPSCDEVEGGYERIIFGKTNNEGYWVSIPDKQFEMQQERSYSEEENGYSEKDMVKFAEFVATYLDKNRNVNGEMLHAKSKYDGAERTIDLLKQFKKK